MTFPTKQAAQDFIDSELTRLAAFAEERSELRSGPDKKGNTLRYTTINWDGCFVRHRESFYIHNTYTAEGEHSAYVVLRDSCCSTTATQSTLWLSPNEVVQL